VSQVLKADLKKVGQMVEIRMKVTIIPVEKVKVIKRKLGR
jgi:hypothetical protein